MAVDTRSPSIELTLISKRSNINMYQMKRLSVRYLFASFRTYTVYTLVTRTKSKSIASNFSKSSSQNQVEINVGIRKVRIDVFFMLIPNHYT